MANEKRLIDANALKEKLQEHHDFFVDGCGGFRYLTPKDQARVDEITNCIAEIVNTPTVDAVEVVHGEWDVITDDCTFDAIYQCSVCKEEFVTNDGTPAENLWHYCPNCGAKMDGGNEDGNL